MSLFKTAEMEHKKELLQIIKTFNAAIVNSRLYSFEHPQVKRYIEETFIELERILMILQEITLIVVGNNLVFRNQTIQGSGPNIAQFISILQDNKIDRISFLPNLPKSALDELIRKLSSSETRELNSNEYIKLGKVEIRVEENPFSQDHVTSDEYSEKMDQLLSLRDETLQEIKGIYNGIKKHKKQIDVRGIEALVKTFIKGFAHGINPISMLASLKSADEYTFTHVINVCILTMSQAESLGFYGEKLYQIGIASVMHDAGKLFIPEEILNKPGMLTSEERAIIETHTTKGARYILGLENIPQIAVLGALEHHIKYNGAGYPAMQKKWTPNIVSQMIAIADVFDAMRSRRVYKEPKPKELIIKILNEEKGTSFNPFLVDHFIKLIKS
jgi:HD-GYP domain-containing protein (c-di-GMP phosphodiesterase class II)